MEIAVTALANLGVKANIQLVPFKRALAMIEAGEADLTTTLSFREDRDAYLLWSAPYRDDTGYVFFTSNDSKFKPKSLIELRNHTVGIVKGYTYPSAFTDDPLIKKVEAQDMKSLVAMLLVGRFDVMIVNSIVGKFELKATGQLNQVTQADFELRSKDAKGTTMGFSKVKKLNPLVEAFNKQLLEMKANGTIARIEKKYLK
jgi:polar amino acid transport system substrate-binding protein